MTTQQTVIWLAQKKHREAWVLSSDVSEQTKAAQNICRAWQQAVHDNFPNRFTEECVVGSDCKEKIDLVDKEDGVAYELKASPNNTHFEFYRDIFKVWVQREIGHEPLKKLVFITPEKGASKINKSFGKEVISIAAKHGLAVEVVGI